MAEEAASHPIVLPGLATGGQVIGNGFFQAILGKRTSGRILNVGGGHASVLFHHSQVLNNTEYHTVEPTNETHPTYVADACAMPQVPSEHYDWLVSVAVLEHIADIRAAAAEISRVVKPGGHIYVSIPMHCEIHWDVGYWDYWRVTPFGMRELFARDFTVLEMEFYGESIVDPFGIAIIARKGHEPVSEVTRFYHVVGGLEKTFRYLDGAIPFEEVIDVWRLRIDPIDYIARVSMRRRQFFNDTKSNLTTLEADRAILPEFAVREGQLIIDNHSARYVEIADCDTA